MPPKQAAGLRARAAPSRISGANSYRLEQLAQDGQELDSMKTTLALSLALAAALSVSACQTPQQNNALVGGALGAGAGALVGSAVSGGSAGGALAGAAIGAAATPAPVGRCAQWGYDYNGNRVCTAFY